MAAVVTVELETEVIFVYNSQLSERQVSLYSFHQLFWIWQCGIYAYSLTQRNQSERKENHHLY